VIGIFVIIFSLICIIGIVIALIVIIGKSDSSFVNEFFRPANFIDPSYFTPFVWACFIAILIPLIALILLSIKMISALKISKYLGYSLLIIWITSIGFVTYYVSIIFMDHAIESSVVETTSLIPKNVYYL